MDDFVDDPIYELQVGNGEVLIGFNGLTQS